MERGIKEFATLTCGRVPCFTRRAKQGRRQRKNYINRHRKAQQLVNKVGWKAYHELWVLL